MTVAPGRPRILVIKLGALGDFIQAIGPMAAIRRHHADADITLLTTNPFVSIGLSCGLFDHVWTDMRPAATNLRGWIALRRQLRDGRFTRVYDLQNNDRTALYLRLFSRRARPEWVGAAPGASHRNADPARTEGTGFSGHVQTLTLAGITDVAPDDLSWMTGPDHGFDVPRPYILIVPGSAPSRPEKRWPAARFGELARRLDGWGMTPVIIGTGDESAAAQTIRSACPGAIDMTGQTAITDLPALARGAAGAIGNDTGPMHLIAPTGCPSFVIFSRHSNPVRHAPLGANVRVIQAPDLSDLSVDGMMDGITLRDFRGVQV